ncbi:MAG: BlaI/MecI/CopY family transcriptional regulator [Clostridiaceae bacterium]|jgi:BlaI family penicillinase repressor|nr:BlaI/MecI/CopY family transcriptional regulator [Clostridiaceae bacterium]
MESIKLFDSELKLMELIWENPNISAKELSLLAGETIGWNKNTTYTVLKKLVAKKAVSRVEPNFICVPLIEKEQVRYDEAKALVDKLYDGSVKMLFSSFLNQEKLSKQEILQIRNLIDTFDKDGG